jgi:hypothetical protein
MLLTAVTTRKRSRILWLAERRRPYFLLHPSHLPVFPAQPSQRRPRNGSPWIPALLARLRSCATERDSTRRFGIFDELLVEREFLELQRYLEGTNRDLQVFKTWKPADFTRVPLALASWDMAGYLLVLSGNFDYNLSFSAVGCAETVGHPELLGSYSSGELVEKPILTPRIF